MSGPYDDIINLPHPTSTKHPRMPMSDRAAIFSPFAALTGHAAAIQETARLTDQRMELDEDTKAMLDLKQQILADRIAERPEISVVWFRPDARKEGGQYVTTVGQLKKVDDIARILQLADGTTIPLDEVLELRSGCFHGIFRMGRCKNDVTPCNPSPFPRKRLYMYRLSLWDSRYFSTLLLVNTYGAACWPQ